ncbi:MAG: hypothetical protein AAB439_00775 [Patescibacteria group bacterium]
MSSIEERAGLKQAGRELRDVGVYVIGWSAFHLFATIPAIVVGIVATHALFNDIPLDEAFSIFATEE